jgi:hypothetical protein
MGDFALKATEQAGRALAAATTELHGMRDGTVGTVRIGASALHHGWRDCGRVDGV